MKCVSVVCFVFLSELSRFCVDFFVNWLSLVSVVNLRLNRLVGVCIRFSLMS